MTSIEIEKKVKEIEKEIQSLNEVLIKEKKYAFIQIDCKRLDVLHKKSDMMLSFQIGV
jgi:hypothetical protein